MAALLANLPSLSVGLALGWSAPALPLLSNDSVEGGPGLRLSLETCSWLGALLPLASQAGALLAGPLAERAGRKGALLISAAPTLIGWLLMTFAGSSLWLLLVGRILTGMTAGASSAPSALYCEEIADARVRGALGTYQFMGNSVGVFIMYVLGAIMPYHWFTAAPLLPTLIFVFTFYWMPETPAFLAARSRFEAAHEALRWLRGPAIDPEAEIRVLLDGPQSPLTSRVKNESCWSAFRKLSWIQPWRSTTIRGFFLSASVMVFQQMSGMILFVFYTVQVLQEVGGSVSSYSALIILGAINMGAVFVSIFLVDRAGRRILLLISCIGMGLCLSATAAYSLVKDEYNYDGDWRWFPICAIAIHGLCFSVGIGPVAWILMAELQPMESKGWAGPSVVIINRMAMFLVAKEAPLMLAHMGQFTTFTFFAVFALLGAVFIAFFLPETKEKTKPEILQALGGDLP